MDAEQTKSRTTLRLMIAGLGIALAAMVGWNEGVANGVTVLLVTSPPLFVAYMVMGSRTRCPSCREPFALEPGERGTLLTTHTCRYCGHQKERINSGPGSGGGGA